MAHRPLVAGNWKMNGLTASLGELQKIMAGADNPAAVDLMICPPATLIAEFAKAAKAAAKAAAKTAAGGRVAIGGQDCHALAAGPHTGDISAEMLRDAGAQAVIVGHSERRRDHCETDATVRAKALAAHRAGLTAIVCIGEERDDRDTGQTRHVVGRQLDGSLPDSGANVVVAYEPVWAIGSGQTPTPGDIGDIHDFIRARLCLRFGEAGHAVRILYGGSVKPANAKALLRIDNVDGALVGGASLNADEFLGIAGVYR